MTKRLRSQKELKCEKCAKVFDHELSFKVHSDYCHSDKKCKVCGKKFTNLKSLRRHVISVHEKALIYQCDKCEESFSVQNHLHLHKMKAHENVQFKCANCGNKFAHSTNLKKHLEKCKPENPSQMTSQCDKCHRVFRLEASLKSHRLVCAKKLKNGQIKCDICDLNFGKIEELQLHIRKLHGTSSGKKPKLTVLRSNKSNLVTPLLPLLPEPEPKTKNSAKENQIILTQRPKKDILKCSKCPKTFQKNRYELYKHEEKVHKLFRNFACHICDFKFLVRKNYSEHLRKIHDHKCEVCKKSFKEKQDFIDHYETGMCDNVKMLEFTQKLSSFCEICHKKFPGAEALEHHVNNTHLAKLVKRTNSCQSMKNSQVAFMFYFGLQKIPNKQ